MDDRPYIVVVEDEVTQRDLLVTYLSRNGYRVNGLEGGPELRRLVDRELPNLVYARCGSPGRRRLCTGSVAPGTQRSSGHNYGNGCS